MRVLPLLGTALLPGYAAAADPVAGVPASLPGILAPAAVTSLLIALALVLLFVFGLYAYASLARFAPYHEWIYLYLVSFSGIVWALFLVNNGGSSADTVFVLFTIAGINLIVHVFRFDRIEIPFPGRAVAMPASGPADDRTPVPLPGKSR